MEQCVVELLLAGHALVDLPDPLIAIRAAIIVAMAAINAATIVALATVMQPPSLTA